MKPYRVELEELHAFIERLRSFDQRADAISQSVNRQIEALHDGNWSGEAAEAHQARHAEWSETDKQMREALAELRAAADRAHRNYSEVIEINTAMWPS
ncbi:WXG100 family type VII secretion target [Mycolicibacterium smegmatis]|uniref:WXG100 family type VII secretion target n=1 Tax=Mycolicibacterium smegmatis TaxID=1772 RepID=UPI001E3BD411|nr:WXG100 family type VII secretion target [Mycolicibacterium smegmatis]UGU29884.1 WXG100 family type VII secretion target [Mycolicibacterium smegmatis]ULN70821.1 WXG100 family type VII secretion target [Mycolicibacterium smegmatis]